MSANSRNINILGWMAEIRKPRKAAHLEPQLEPINSFVPYHLQHCHVSHIVSLIVCGMALSNGFSPRYLTETLDSTSRRHFHQNRLTLQKENLIGDYKWTIQFTTKMQAVPPLPTHCSHCNVNTAKSMVFAMKAPLKSNLGAAQCHQANRI
jgi:hypothetical protein